MNNLKKYILITCSIGFIAEILYSTDRLTENRFNVLKKYTLAVFMAADNNLAPYALYNLTQMTTIGSNHNINIVVQINTPGNLNATQRYYIEKGKKTLIQGAENAPTQKLNSGSPQTLIDFVSWAMKEYPAHNLILNLWSHGSGIYDPQSIKKIKELRSEYDEAGQNEMFVSENSDEIDSFERRGICFDDTFKSYMNNQDIKFALHEIQQKVLRGKKISVLWLEACLMSMIEVTNIFKDHVEYLVSSENVEYAPGSNYQFVLSPFVTGVPTPREFACHIVDSFQKAYGTTKLNYTQSAIDLSKVNAIESNINLLAQQLLMAIQEQKDLSVTKLLEKCKSRPLCTCFHEPSFIDLRHFYMNLQSNIAQIKLINATKEGFLKMAILKLIDQGLYLIKNAIIANAAGNNLKNACGLSIYFPEQGIFNSYLKSNFAQSNNWSTMLMQYILQSK